MRQKNKDLPARPNVVGIVDSERALQIAEQLPAGAVDILEWRADCLSLEIPSSRFPWILTARHPAEGGRSSLSTAERRNIFLHNLKSTSAVDIEARSLHAMKEVIKEANNSGVRVIASFHDFNKTPTAAVIKNVVSRSLDAGADIVKIAAVPQAPEDVARLLTALSNPNLPVSVMGMGPLGMASRVLFAACGSILNYGWLHKPNVPGQWSAVEFKQLLKKIRAR